MKKIAQGAEAVIHSDGKQILKHRIKRTYRHPDIDVSLRKFRTRREAKVLEKLRDIGFPAPKLHRMSDEEMTIHMEHIKGEPVKNVLEKDYKAISKEIGEKVAKLHEHNIIHNDLTTSNMIYNKGIYFIDFGLSFFSEREEDKAVDLHLLKRALDSKHPEICEECFAEVLKGYKKYPEHKKVIERLKIVEARGRNKHK